MSDVDAVLRAALDESGLRYEQPSPGAFLVTLPGTAKLATVCWLVVGDHSLLVEAFFMRAPDENHAELYRFLLGRNARMYGVAFAIDQAGDVYLMGRLSLQGVTEDELDRLLGAVVTYADESFDPMLEIGFGSAIRREWQWRVKRGEPLDNLRAFEHFVKRSE